MFSADRILLVLAAAPIAAMLVMGVLIAARSGVATLATGQGLRLVVWNLSKTLLLLGAWVLSMLVLHLVLDVPLLPS